VDAYETHFGFSEPPFSLTPDPRFFYANASYQEAYATLRYGVEARKGFIVVTGEAGTGKTTLLRILMQNAGSRINTAFIFNPPHESGELLRMILKELEVPAPAEARVDLLTQFNEYLLEQLRKRQIVALLIDEAQGLSRFMLEELRLLSNLETSKEKLIQIVLMGQPELEGKLEQPDLRQLKQRVALRCRLDPLVAEEVSGYIEFRLETAGYQGKGLFDAGAVERVACYSQGIPRLINVICENALLRAYKSSKNRVSPDMVDEAAKELRFAGVQPTAARPAVKEPSMEDTAAKPVAPLRALERPNETAPMRYDFDIRERGEEAEAGQFRARGLFALLPVGIWLAAFLIAASGLALYTNYNGSVNLAPVAHLSGASRTAHSWPLYVPEAGGTRRAPHADGAEIKLSPIQAPLPFDSGLIRDDSGVKSPAGSNAHEPAPAEPQRPAFKGRTPVEFSRRAEDGLPGSDSRGAKTDAVRPKGKSSTARTFNVVGASFVRETPRSDAAVTDTLEPGTRVQVLGKAGEYFRVRALDGETTIGYVHQEDAFFEPSR
jgi:type II secretory pathway predicted ATPase ExeA